jgi:F0F1-type ATP synthase gamma subunit
MPPIVLADLASALQLEYNKARQQGITSEILDIVGVLVLAAK